MKTELELTTLSLYPLALTRAIYRVDFIDTLTGVTQWERPGPDAFVIPLGLIQVSMLWTRQEIPRFVSAEFFCSAEPLHLGSCAAPEAASAPRRSSIHLGYLLNGRNRWDFVNLDFFTLISGHSNLPFRRGMHCRHNMATIQRRATARQAQRVSIASAVVTRWQKVMCAKLIKQFDSIIFQHQTIHFTIQQILQLHYR